MRFKRIYVHKCFFQRKMVIDILKGIEDVDKIKKEEQEVDLKEKDEIALTG